MAWRVTYVSPNLHHNSLARFSDEALDEQKHSIRIADEKVALAVQAYDLVCILHPQSLIVSTYVHKLLV